MTNKNGSDHVIIVAGGFAGAGCACNLASQKEVRVTLIGWGEDEDTDNGPETGQEKVS